MVGTSVGDNDGVLLIAFDGISDALIVGLLLRPPVGSLLKMLLGFELGLLDGLSMGLVEGPPLGEKLGKFVVSSVGT